MPPEAVAKVNNKGTPTDSHTLATTARSSHFCDVYVVVCDNMMIIAEGLHPLTTYASPLRRLARRKEKRPQCAFICIERELRKDIKAIA